MIKRYAPFILIAFFACCGFVTKANTVQPVIRVDSIPKQLDLDTCWKFHAGDDLQWAATSFNDKDWDTLVTDMMSKHALTQFKGIGWFRIRLKVAPSLFHGTFVLKMEQAGASDVYLNGKKIYRFGAVSNSVNEVPFNPKNNTYFIQFSTDTIQVIAVRYSAYAALQKKYYEPGFSLSLSNVEHLAIDTQQKDGTVMFSIFFLGIFLTLAMFHLLLFLFHRKTLSNLYYSIMAFVLSFFWLYPAILAKSGDPFIANTLNETLLYIYAPFFFFIVLLVYSIFKVKFNLFFWIILAIAVLSDVLTAANAIIENVSEAKGIPAVGYLMLGSIILSSIESFRITINAVRAKKPGAWIIATGFGIFCCYSSSYFVICYYNVIDT